MKTNWWKNLYDDNLEAILLQPADDKELKATCSFLIEKLALTNSTVFDQCCGNGRIANALSSHGHRVFGVDQASSYIEHARSAARPETHFEVGDAFLYTPPESCDAAFNWWTSFGYSSDDEVNKQMLQRTYESLKTGGKFALDYMNTPNIYASFKPEMVTRQEIEGGTLLLIRESRLDLCQEALYKTWTYILPDGKQVEHKSHTKLYTPGRLKELFLDVGFRNIEFFGDESGAELKLKSPRCIIIGQK